MYSELFNDWKDVQDQFSTDEKEPDEVLYAVYSYESYSGDAAVAYRNGDKYFINEGGHCSCNGLEGQWSPVEYESKELFLACLEKMKDGYGHTRDMSNFLLGKLKN